MRNNCLSERSLLEFEAFHSEKWRSKVNMDTIWLIGYPSLPPQEMDVKSLEREVAFLKETASRPRVHLSTALDG